VDRRAETERAIQGAGSLVIYFFAPGVVSLTASCPMRLRDLAALAWTRAPEPRLLPAAQLGWM
jgi:hypothetical protein